MESYKLMKPSKTYQNCTYKTYKPQPTSTYQPTNHPPVKPRMAAFQTNEPQVFNNGMYITCQLRMFIYFDTKISHLFIINLGSWLDMHDRN